MLSPTHVSVLDSPAGALAASRRPSLIPALATAAATQLYKFVPPPDASASMWRQTPALRARRAFGSRAALIDESRTVVRGLLPVAAAIVPDTPIVCVASATPLPPDRTPASAASKSLPGRPPPRSQASAGVHFFLNNAEERLLDPHETRSDPSVGLSHVHHHATDFPVLTLDVGPRHILTGGPCGRVALLSYSIAGRDGSANPSDPPGTIVVSTEADIHIGPNHMVEQIRPSAPGVMSGSVAVRNIGFLPTRATLFRNNGDPSSPASPMSLASLGGTPNVATSQMYASVGDKLILFDINTNASENTQIPTAGFDFDLSHEVIQSISAESYVRTSLLALGSSDKSVSIVDTRLCEQASRHLLQSSAPMSSRKRGSIISVASSASGISSASGVVWTAENAHDGPVQCVRFNPFIPYMLASSGMDGVVKVWDIRYFKNPAARIDGHYSSVESIAWSTSHVEQLATASLDHRWRLWQLSSSTSTALTPDFDFLVDCPGSDVKRKALESNTVIGAQLLAETTVPISPDSQSTAALTCTIASNRHLNTYYTCSVLGTVTSHTLRRELLDEHVPENYDSLQYPQAHNVETFIYHRSLTDAYDELYTLAEEARERGKLQATFESELFELCSQTPEIDSKSWVIPPPGTESARIGGPQMIRGIQQLLNQYASIMPPGLDRVLDVNRLVPKRLAAAFELIKKRHSVLNLALKAGKSDNSTFLKEFEEETTTLAQKYNRNSTSSPSSDPSTPVVDILSRKPLDPLYDSAPEFMKEMMKIPQFINAPTLSVFARALLRDDFTRGLSLMSSFIQTVAETKNRDFSDACSAFGLMMFPTVYEHSTDLFLTGSLVARPVILDRKKKFIQFLAYLEEEELDGDDADEQSNVDSRKPGMANRLFMETLQDFDEQPKKGGITPKKGDNTVNVVQSPEKTKSDSGSISSIASKTAHGSKPPNGASIATVSEDSNIRGGVSSSSPSGAPSRIPLASRPTHGYSSSGDSTASSPRADVRTLLAGIPRPWMEKYEVRDNAIFIVGRDPSIALPMIALELRVMKILSAKGLNIETAKEIISLFGETNATSPTAGQVHLTSALESTISVTTIQTYFESLALLSKFDTYFSLLFDMATLYNRHVFPTTLLKSGQTIGLTKLQQHIDSKVEVASTKIAALAEELQKMAASSAKLDDATANHISELVRESVREAAIPLQEVLLMLMRIGACIPRSSMVSGQGELMDGALEDELRKLSSEIGSAILAMFADTRDSLYQMFGTARKVLSLATGGTVSALPEGVTEDLSLLGAHASISLGTRIGATGAMTLCERVISLQTAVKGEAALFAQRRTFGLHVGVMAVGGKDSVTGPPGTEGVVANTAGEMAAAVSALLGALDKGIMSLSSPK